MADKTQITLTYLNIRQSISILLAKLILIDFVLIVSVILFYFAILSSQNFILGLNQNNPIFLIVIGFIGIFKIFISSYVILSWLYEYYELTPEYIVHKHGIVFRKTEHYRLSLVREMVVDDTFLGGLFNCATISLFEIRLNKYLDMYLIHNARRYAKIIKELRPQIEIKEKHVWMPYKKEDDFLSHE